MKSKTGFVYNEIFLNHTLGGDHVESPQRLRSVVKRLVSTGLKTELLFLDPLEDRTLIEKAILAIHSQAHYESVVKWGVKSDPALFAAGGVLKGVDAVMRGEVENVFCAVRPPGHHSQNHGAHCDGRYQGEGFCFFNNIAIGARYAQLVHKVKRILIVDWDFHHGNGTEWAFYDDPSVFYFSTHSMYDYPTSGSPLKTGVGRGKGYNLNVPLPPGASDSDLIDAFQNKLIPALREREFEPGLVMISAGFDSRKDDLLGNFEVTDKGFLELTKIMKGIARAHCKGRLVSVLEGGYNGHGLAQAVAVHLRGLLNGDHLITAV